MADYKKQLCGRGSRRDVTRATNDTKAERTTRHYAGGNCRGASGAVPRPARRAFTRAIRELTAATGLEKGYSKSRRTHIEAKR
jgi:hypothetical protein